MEATRARLGSAIEWALAAFLFVVALAAGSIALREFRTVTAVIPVSAHEPAPPAAHAGVPSRAVSVPLLLLADGRTVRIGDTAAAVAAHVGSRQVGADTIEQTPVGERVTRVYELGDARFVLVIEGAQVAAIYLR